MCANGGHNDCQAGEGEEDLANLADLQAGAMSQSQQRMHQAYPSLTDGLSRWVDNFSRPSQQVCQSPISTIVCSRHSYMVFMFSPLPQQITRLR